MECLRTALFVVLTLLPLCQAEPIQPQWYSAKLNGDFQPKPISEIFTSDPPPFSTAKPIVVTQNINSIPNEINLLSSSLPPPSSRFESTKLTQQTLPSTTAAMPAGALYQQVNFENYNPLQVDILPQLQNYLQPNHPYVPPFQLIPQTIQRRPIEPQLQSVTEFPAQVTRIQSQRQPEQTFTPGLPLTTLFQPQTQTTQTQPTSTQLPTLAVSNPTSPASFSPPPASFAPQPASFAPPNSNFFLMYQQAPQAIPAFPPSSPSGPGISEVTIRETTPTTISLPPRTSEGLSTTRAFPITSFSTTTPLPTTFLSTPLPTSTLSSSSVTVTPSSTLGLSTGGCISSTTAVPSLLLNGLNKKATGTVYPLKIRVIAPSGSITNVNINSLTTTRKPVTPRSTTRKPTTRKTSKPKKNSYDRCLDGCRKVKDPICAAPLSHREIDPKTLRGFPSVCHMACHNSYRKNPFEKVIEGSCSKLRTRIRLIDSRNKLKKDELHRNEYSVDQGEKTVIELTGLA